MDALNNLQLLNTNHIIFFTAYSILACFIIACNISVLVPILVNKSLRTENRFIYMLSTCSSDLCTGFSCFYVGSRGATLDIQASQANSYYIVPTFMGLSYLVTLAAQADRYHAVSSPYKYPQRISLCRTIFVVVTMWVYAFLIVAVNNLVTSSIAIKVTGTGTFVCYLFTMVIMIGLNIKLFMIAKYQLERDPPSSDREAKRSSLYLIIVVSGFFLATWIPIMLYNILCDFIALPCNIMRKEEASVFKMLPRINAAITPMLYISGCTPLRVSLIKVWSPVCRCRRHRRICTEMRVQNNSQPASSVVIISNTVQ